MDRHLTSQICILDLHLVFTPSVDMNTHVTCLQNVYTLIDINFVFRKKKHIVASAVRCLRIRQDLDKKIQKTCFETRKQADV